VELTQQEKELLEGRHGRTLQKIMKSLVLYGRAVGATKLVAIEGPGHFALAGPELTTGPDQGFLDELTEAGLKTPFPFTLDPRGVSDFKGFDLNSEQKRHFEGHFESQAKFDESMLKLGLRDGGNAYTCTPYLSEVGNTPEKGTVLAWSESRKACRLIDLVTSDLPHPQLLGGAIGVKVLEDVPYIRGLDRFLGCGLNERSLDYLKEMGAACAAIGAVGLYHVENITPEAVEQALDLMLPEYRNYTIDDRELLDLRSSYPNLWQDKKAAPRRCLVGCPHLSLRELRWWADGINQSLARKNKGRVAVDTFICAAPQVLSRLEAERGTYERLIKAGVRLSSFCLECYMNNPHCSAEPIITNSNKLRAFTSARFYPDEELLEIVTG